MSNFLTDLETRFTAYAHSFRDGTEADSNIDLKIEHSINVYRLAEKIGRAEKLAPETMIQLRCAALLHDIGRFPQYAKYRTFNDARSCNHALRGVRQIQADGLLASLPDSHRRNILGAIALHNRYKIPDVMPEPMGTLARIVRDSDKIDIFRVLANHLTQPGEKDPVVILHVEDKPGVYSSALIAAIENGECGNYKDLHYANDLGLLLLSWLPLLHSRESVKIIASLPYMDKIKKMLPDTVEIRGAVRRIDNYLTQNFITLDG